MIRSIWASGSRIVARAQTRRGSGLAFSKSGSARLGGVIFRTTSAPTNFYRSYASEFSPREELNPEKALQTLKRSADPPSAKSIAQIIRKCDEYLIDTAESAFKYFNQQASPASEVYEAIITFYTNAGKKERAEKLLRDMRKHGFKPSVPLYKSVMSLSAALKDEAAVDSLYALLKEDYPVKSHVDEVYVTAIHAYGKLKSFAKCEDFIEEIRDLELHPTNAIYTALLEAYAKANNVEKGIVLFKQMKHDGLKPNHIMFNNLLAAGARLKNVSLTERLFRDMKSYGLKPDIVTYNSLIDAYCRAENLRDARRTMLDMDRAGIKPDAVSYGPLIVALVKQKQMEQADGLLREMEYAGVKPDELIWNWLIEGYARTDQLEKAFEITKQMQERSVPIGKKLKHVLLTQARKQNKMEFFESQFGPVTPKKQPWEMSYQEEFEALVPMAKPKGKAGKWPLMNSPMRDSAAAETPLMATEDGAPVSTRPLSNEIIPELELGEKFKPSDWLVVDDPFSTPKPSTLERRKTKEIAASKLKLVNHQIEKDAETLSKQEKLKAKKLDRAGFQKQRRKEYAKSEEMERARNKKRKKMAKAPPGSKKSGREADGAE
eukprot:TRINITY_DN7439_c0_g1_i1.p1 TRINITY_DN7439_c0_g1~~TRINITY_DN7439_c0_g1_i1.p1  ORF type:complete len:604 (+),score=119.60 TRINITY_DN7439_c0_g1_i1:22-1833(+)